MGIFFLKNKIISANLCIFIIISFNIALSNIYFELPLLIALLIFIIKWDVENWTVPLYIFFWGIYQDIILGISLGYSSLIFLSYFLLNQLAIHLGIYETKNIKFTLFLFLSIFIFIVEYLFIYYKLAIQLPFITNFLPILIIILLFYPTEILYSLIKNSYEKIR